MAWGGGTITGGAPMGGAVGGSPGNPGNGLPFAGIPSELRQGVEKLLADEPDHEGDPRWQATEVTFHHRMKETGVSLRRLLASAPADADRLRAVSILVEALCVQAGPLLTQNGIDDGITPHDWTALTIIGDPRHPRGRGRPRWRAAPGSPTTGRLASPRHERPARPHRSPTCSGSRSTSTPTRRRA